ncbi:MAG: ATP-binding cassette domain-containing protein [Pseudomonadota bacterium]
MAERVLPLAFEGVSYQANGQALVEQLGFQLEARPLTVVLGPNGAGKSLLLRLAQGLIAPSAGRISWNGRPVAAVRRSLALAFQRPVLLRRSAAANVAYPLKLRGVSGPARRKRAAEALARVGLSALAERPARVLSGGEQQRLALARAWASEPAALLLDEPTSNLDPAATRAVEEIVGAFKAAGTKVVLTTHDLGQAKRLADEVLFLHRGRLVEQTPAAEFFQQPRSEEARAFVEGRILW